MAQPSMGWHAFNWALRARIPDPSVVDYDARSSGRRR